MSATLLEKRVLRVTISQIAERVGISPGTVSRVLNGKIKENRPAILRRANRIRAVAKEMGYRPNVAAQAMIHGRFNQMAFVTCGELGFDWFAPRLLHGIHTGVHLLGSALVINELAMVEFDDPEKLPRLFQQSSVDAMFVNIDSKVSDRILALFDEQPVPAVLLNQKRNTRSVYPDEYRAGAAIARHLLRCGRKRIGYLKLDHAARMRHYSAVDRHQGVVDTLAEAGADVSATFNGDPSFRRGSDLGFRIVSDFLDRHANLDAVVCYGSMEANMLHSIAMQRRIEVPKQLDIVVFDHQVLHAQTGYPLSTLIVPFQQVGERAVEMASIMIDGDGERRPPSIAVPYTECFLGERHETVDCSGW